MATLVQFLAAGVNGAANGSATFLLRGTASSAAAFLYNDFERTAQPGTNVITLDANGSAEVYCSVYVDVVIRNSAGTTLRTVTVGNSSGVVEVRSTSFRGDDYDGSPSNTVSQPITLTAVLNQWILSAGAPDWQVLVDGVAVNLQTAVAGFTGIFINVKDPQYGAQGDGVTSDTTAIANAFADADAIGGVVVFPPGTYLCGQVVMTGASFCAIGFGQAIIRGTSAGGAIFAPNNTNPGMKVFSGLRFEGNGSPAHALDLSQMEVSIDGCHFDQTGFTTRLIRFRDGGGIVYITRCTFDVTTGNPIQHVNGDNKQVMISDCHFTLAAGFTNAVISGSCFNITNCVFDGSAVVAGTYYMINPEHPTTDGLFLGNVSNCKFIDGGSSGFAFSLGGVGADCDFSEDNNSFIGFTEPADVTDPGHIYAYSNTVDYDETSRIHLGSRLGKQLTFALGASGSISGVECFLVADTIVVVHTNASNLSFANDPSDKPFGLKWNVVVHNESGGTRDIVFSGNGQLATVSSVVDDGRAMANVFSYLSSAGTMATAIAGTGQAS